VITRRRQIQTVLQLFGDVLATALAMVLAYWFRFDLQVVPVTKGVPPWRPYINLIPVTALLWPTVFYFQGLYQHRRARSRFDEVVRILVAVAFATTLLTAALTFYREFSYSRLVLAIFAVFDIVLVTLTRWAIAATLARIRRLGGNLQQVLVVGAGDLGRQVVDRLKAHREYGAALPVCRCWVRPKSWSRSSRSTTSTR
jgi:FlaA1/EpsC-like NDP-sugar epimerase